MPERRRAADAGSLSTAPLANRTLAHPRADKCAAHHISGSLRPEPIEDKANGFKDAGVDQATLRGRLPRVLAHLMPRIWPHAFVEIGRVWRAGGLIAAPKPQPTVALAPGGCDIGRSHGKIRHGSPA